MPKHEYGQEGGYLQNQVFLRLLMWGAPLVLLAIYLISFAFVRPPACVTVIFFLLLPLGPGLAKRWERAASKSIEPYVTGFKGERNVAGVLRAELGDDFYVVHDVDFEHGNVDHIVVAPAGVFTVETKADHGKAVTKGDKLYVNGFDRESSLKPSPGERRQRHSTTCYSPLNKAVLRRPLEPAQYTSYEYTERLKRAGIAPSRGRTGTALDNAMAESIMSTLKRELTKRDTWRTRLDLELALVTYIGWYNARRRHRSLKVVENGRVRRLTPLQALDRYTQEVAMLVVASNS
jgi:putative transposase